MHDSLVLASLRKISLIFFNYLFDYLLFRLMRCLHRLRYKTSLVICRTFHWKYEEIAEKSILLVLFVYLIEYYKSPYTSILHTPLLWNILVTHLRYQDFDDFWCIFIVVCKIYDFQKKRLDSMFILFPFK